MRKKKDKKEEENNTQGEKKAREGEVTSGR